MLICCKKEIKILDRKTESTYEPWAPTSGSFWMRDPITVINTNRMVIPVSVFFFNPRNGKNLRNVRGASSDNFNICFRVTSVCLVQKSFSVCTCRRKTPPVKDFNIAPR